MPRRGQEVQYGRCIAKKCSAACGTKGRDMKCWWKVGMAKKEEGNCASELARSLDTLWQTVNARRALRGWMRSSVGEGAQTESSEGESCLLNRFSTNMLAKTEIPWHLPFPLNLPGTKYSEIQLSAKTCLLWKPSLANLLATLCVLLLVHGGYELISHGWSNPLTLQKCLH